MKKLIGFLFALLATVILFAQVEPAAGKWKTWFISSGADFVLPKPPLADNSKAELKEIQALQQNLDSVGLLKLLYWNAGSPGYRWRDVLQGVSSKDTSGLSSFTSMLLSVATYDAMVAAWRSKYQYNRLRPFEQDKGINVIGIRPSSPSYPCENAVAAGVATAIVAHFYPEYSDSIMQLAKDAMQARVAAGLQYASDTKAGFELGQKVAFKAIERTKDFLPSEHWDGNVPEGAGLWRGKNPLFPLMGKRKTMVLQSGSQFRPGPPPDYQKEMEELKNFKPTYRSMSNAFVYANAGLWRELFDRKIFEYNLHLNPPQAERIHALRSIAIYDALTACWDAKYAYWGIRPDQYDTTFKPALMHTPNFPGYPSGHAAGAGALTVLLCSFFPADKVYFEERARDAAEARFEGGVHFRSDNVVGLDLGKKVGELVLQRAKEDGAGLFLIGLKQRK